MNIVYFGSSEFSLGVLQTMVAAKVVPTLIVSQPDRPKGRGLHIIPTPVSLFAEQKSIPLIKPASLRDQSVQQHIAGYQPQFFVIADYGKILPKELLTIPTAHPLGVHPSLLPKYRGPAPIDWAIINGETETGVTIFCVQETVDSGEIVLQQKTPLLPDDTVLSLRDRLAQQGGTCVVKAMNMIIAGKAELIAQDEKQAVMTRKLNKDDGNICWEMSAKSIYNVMRGTFGWPSAYTFYQGKLLKILAAQVIDDQTTDTKPGTIVAIDKTGICVATKKGVLKVTRVQPENAKAMDSNAFMCGHQVQVGDRFSRER